MRKLAVDLKRRRRRRGKRIKDHMRQRFAVMQGAAVFVFSGNKERRIKMPAIRSKALHWIRKHGIIIPPLIVNKVASALWPIA